MTGRPFSLPLQFLLITGLRHEEKTIKTVADIIQGRRDDAGAEKDSIASVRRNRLTCGGGARMGF